MTRDVDGSLRFCDLNGRLLPDVPPPALVLDAAEVIRTRNDEEGLDIHERTGLSGWLGERLDAGWAIDVLHPLANPPR